MTIKQMPDYIFDTDFLNPDEAQEVLSEIADAPFHFGVHGILASNDGKVGIGGNNFSDRIIMVSGSNDLNDFDQLRPMAKSLVEKFCEKHGLKLLDIYRTRTNITFKSFDRRPTVPHVDLRGKVKHHIFLYYVNDCDGDTIVFTQKADGKEHTQDDLHIWKRFTPKGGAALLFDGDYFHTWEHPLIAEFRSTIVVNIAVEEL